MTHEGREREREREVGEEEEEEEGGRDKGRRLEWRGGGAGD